MLVRIKTTQPTDRFFSSKESHHAEHTTYYYVLVWRLRRILGSYPRGPMAALRRSCQEVMIVIACCTN